MILERVAVFGGAGFIGTNLIHRFIGEGRQVYDIDNLSRYGTLLNLTDLLKEPSHFFIQCNYANKEEAEQALFSVAVDTIFICSSTPTDSEVVKNEMKSLLDTLISWRKQVVSSDDTNHRIYCIIPQKQYTGEPDPRIELLREYSTKLPLVTLAVPFVFGPFQQPDSPIPYVIYRAIEGESIPFLEDKVISLPLLYIDDVLRAVGLLEEQKDANGVYFLDYARPQLSNIEIVDTICDTLNDNYPPPIGRYQSLITKIDFPVGKSGISLKENVESNTLVLPETTDLKIALKKTILWYLENPSWYTQSKSRFFDLWSNLDGFEQFLRKRSAQQK